MSHARERQRLQADLVRQIDELNSLRNANTRDNGFKMWRQATLTLIQRAWEGDDTRSSYFRRIPFSPPSNLAEARETREWFERGCKEAAGFMRRLVAEMQGSGFALGSSPPANELEPLPTNLADFPIEPAPAPEPEVRPATTIARLPLGHKGSKLGGNAEPATTPDATSPDSATPESSTPEELPASAIEASAPAPPIPAPVAADIPLQIEPTPPPPLPHKRPGSSTRTGRSNGGAKKAKPRERLKDMLGFVDPPISAASSTASAAEPPTTPVQRAAANARAAAAATPSPIAPPSSIAPLSSVTPPSSIAPPEFQLPPEAVQGVPARAPKPAVAPPAVAPPPAAAEPPPPAAAPPAAAASPAPAAPVAPATRFDEMALQRALEAALQSFVHREVESEEGAAPPDLLSGSPIFNVQPRPVRRRVGSAPDSFQSSPAIAVAAIASEVASFGVPDGQRGRTRAALLDLAMHLELRDLSWSSLREAVTFVMEYPAVARRVLPLLMPYLEEAA